jgi:glycosyltransferase involved in cell wall biosynthesis
MKVTIVVPCFNEDRFIVELLERLQKRFVNITNHEVEVLIIDDGSTDDSRRLIAEWIGKTEERSETYRCLKHESNQGKGAAIQTAIKHTGGDIFLIQDSDLEYDPSDIQSLLDSYLENQKNAPIAVYGSRNLTRNRPGLARVRLSPSEGQGLMPWLFCHLLSIVFFLRYRVYVSDLLTGYKLVSTSSIKSFDFRTEGFEMDHEISRQLVHAKTRIVEVPITYSPRTRGQGKKIGWRDAILALKEVVRD